MLPCAADDLTAGAVYTPTVGEVCQRFGEQYRRARSDHRVYFAFNIIFRGMYFSTEDRGHFSAMTQNWSD